MEKILNCNGLGVSGRQNEMIELALTHKFDAVEIDMTDLLGRHEALGKEFACQFLQSAKMKIGTFRLPVDLDADDATYNEQLSKIDTVLELAEELNGTCCYVRIAPTHAELSFQENFDRHSTRLAELAPKFAAKSIKIGLALQAAADQKKHDKKFVQTTEELLTLARTIGQPNVGICLDTWNWVVGDGAKDQLSELKADQITEVRLADVPAEVDTTTIKQNQLALAGEVEGSIVPEVLKHLSTISYEGPICVLTASSMLGGRSKNAVVGGIAKQLNRLLIEAGLIEGELEVEEEPATEGEADTEGDSDATQAAGEAKAGEGEAKPAVAVAE